MVGVAQLVRAPGCGPGGRRFKSGRPPFVVSWGKQSVILVAQRLLTLLGGRIIIPFSQRAAAGLPSLRFARSGVPYLPLPRRKNTPARAHLAD